MTAFDEILFLKNTDGEKTWHYVSGGYIDTCLLKGELNDWVVPSVVDNCPDGKILMVGVSYFTEQSDDYDNVRHVSLATCMYPLMTIEKWHMMPNVLTKDD